MDMTELTSCVLKLSLYPLTQEASNNELAELRKRLLEKVNIGLNFELGLSKRFVAITGPTFRLY